MIGHGRRRMADSREQGRWSLLPRMKGESAALGSLAMRHYLNGASRRRGLWGTPSLLIPRQRQMHSKSDGRPCPKSGRAEAREHGSRGQGRRSRWSAHEKRVCDDGTGAQRIGGRCRLAMRHATYCVYAVVRLLQLALCSVVFNPSFSILTRRAEKCGHSQSTVSSLKIYGTASGLPVLLH